MSFSNTNPFVGALRGNESDLVPRSSEYICDGSVGLLINTNDFMTALQKKKKKKGGQRFVGFQSHPQPIKVGIKINK